MPLLHAFFWKCRLRIKLNWKKKLPNSQDQVSLKLLEVFPGFSLYFLVPVLGKQTVCNQNGSKIHFLSCCWVSRCCVPGSPLVVSWGFIKFFLSIIVRRVMALHAHLNRSFQVFFNSCRILTIKCTVFRSCDVNMTFDCWCSHMIGWLCFCLSLSPL